MPPPTRQRRSRPLRPPKPPPPPRVPTLRLQPLRTAESVQLDQSRTRTGQQLPPYVRWDHFYKSWKFFQGEHCTVIGPTGSGKTVLARYLLRRRNWVVIFGVKNRDPELYGPFEREGYELVRTFDAEVPDDEDFKKILFVPRTDKHGAEGNAIRGKAFRLALNDIMDVGKWCVYCDDVQVMADEFRLGPELKEMWRLGRSELISLVVSSQEPVEIPVTAYGQATHIFLFKNTDLYRAKRMAELTGVNREVAQQTILTLPDHEFLYVDKRSGNMVRSRVIRR